MEADVVVVGAGPAGSSVGTFLAQRGIVPLILDKSDFPRDKVCGDGLTPQAIYWLDRLGCVDAVLAETRGCIRDADLYINGRHLLTSRFPQNTAYPDFSVLLDRRRFDALLLRNAQAHGALFKSQCKVTAVRNDGGMAHVEYTHPTEGSGTIKTNLVIGADGSSSIVSRSIGNRLKQGVTAVSVRTYFRNARPDPSQISVYFDERYFPGYGWIFTDDDGFANVGLGYAHDPNFPMPIDLKKTFDRFLATDLRRALRDATQCAGLAGGAASFYKPDSLVHDNILLIGDAANHADPLNGGGIHKAMEGAFVAAEAIVSAFDTRDFTRRSLARYETTWTRRYESDRRTGELFLTVAKNPALRELNLFLLKNIGRLCSHDPAFQEFAAGVFSGVISQSVAVSPLALIDAFPINPGAWLSLLQDVNSDYRLFPMGFATSAATGTLDTFLEMARNPLENLDWGLEVLTKSVRLVDHQIAGRTRNGHETHHP